MGTLPLILHDFAAATKAQRAIADVRLSQESNHHLKFIIGKGVTYIVSNVES
jgi:hypothetical protein